MLSPAAMRKLRICVLERQAGAVAQALGRVGAVHLSSSAAEGEARLQRGKLDDRVAACQQQLARVRNLLGSLGIDPPQHAAVDALSPRAVEVAMRLADSLAERAGGLVGRLKELETELADAEELLDTLEPFRTLTGPVNVLAESELLELSIGTVPRDALAALRATVPAGVVLVVLEPVTALAERVGAVVVGTRRRRFAMETALQAGGFQPWGVPDWQQKAPAVVHEEALERCRSLQQERDGLRGELHDLGAPHAATLQRACGELQTQARILDAQRSFGLTWATAVVTGWVPASRVPAVREAVMAATRGRAVIEVSEPGSEDVAAGRVPSLVEHSGLLAPFSRLVVGYGVPSYAEVEPTVLLGASFLLMFGIIFGDLGHGLCLLAVGLLVLRRGRTATTRDLGQVIALAGAAGALFGTFFQGSFFGASLEDMGFPFTLGFEPIRFEGEQAGSAEQVGRYLLLALGFGTVLISLGVVVNIVNRVRARDYRRGLFGPFGVVGIMFYWGTLALALKLTAAGAGRGDAWLVAVLIVLPLVVLALQEPLHVLLHREEPLSAEGLVLGLAEGLLEVLETVMAYVANTLSFLRMAAFALSHAALCFTIFALERIVGGLPGGPVWAAVVFVVGTALIIVLEGLIVAIQIMRLEYYEFFTKFFGGQGVRYAPFRLD